MIEFVDTNVVLYSCDSDAGPRFEQSVKLLARLATERTGVVSVQVLAEFYVNATRKFRMKSQEAETIIGDFAGWQLHRPDHASIIGSIHLQRRYQLAWYDAMILNSAIEMGCGVLWTEDFTDGQRFGDLVVRNPYKTSSIV